MKLIFSFILLGSFSLLSAQNFKAPDWAKGIVWYQIFPERFANGDTSNDPEAEKVFSLRRSQPENWKVTPWESNWFAEADWTDRFGDVYLRRYGGDLQGVINRLDYIQELGIGAIYFNPLFEAVSLHKYDGSTFHHIDVNFGPDPEGDRKLIAAEDPTDPSTWKMTSADKLFFKMLEECKKRNIRVIIDGVFNHTGEMFFAFKDLEVNQHNSVYKNWFIVNKFDDPDTEENEFDYKGWWGIKSLPEFNRTEDNLMPEIIEYVKNATSKWMDPNGDGNPKDGIDGWRLDVAKEVPLNFWYEWAEHVRSINPEAYIVGEIWELAPDHVGEDKPFDAVMNYNFTFAVNRFFVWEDNKILTDEFIEMLNEIDNTYDEENLHVLQNLMSSHDTERLSSLVMNPGRRFDHDANTGNENYNPGKPTMEAYNKQKQIAAFQMLYRGAPMIYYGDEVGMWGADDPHDRKPMVWDDIKYDDEIISGNFGFKKGHGTYTVEQNKDLLEFYKKIIQMRNDNEVLRTGKLNFIYYEINKPVFAFARENEESTIIAYFNLSGNDETAEIPKSYYRDEYTNLISGDKFMPDGINNIKIPANSFIILKQ